MTTLGCKNGAVTMHNTY